MAGGLTLLFDLSGRRKEKNEWVGEGTGGTAKRMELKGGRTPFPSSKERHEDLNREVSVQLHPLGENRKNR